FEYDADVYDYAQTLWANKDKKYNEWIEKFNEYQKAYPELAKKLNLIVNKEVSYDLSGVEFTESNVATRNYIATIMKYIDANYNSVVGGSADLFAATKVGFAKQFASESGANIKYGIREFAMGSINNGINLDTGLKTIDSTFLAFADYMKPALRLGALMEQPAIHVFTHDSYQVGGDGPTHQ
ncbi:transketolase, partial [Mycoplasmopsis pullorum]